MRKARLLVSLSLKAVFSFELDYCPLRVETWKDGFELRTIRSNGQGLSMERNESRTTIIKLLFKGRCMWASRCESYQLKSLLYLMQKDVL